MCETVQKRYSRLFFQTLIQIFCVSVVFNEKTLVPYKNDSTVISYQLFEPFENGRVFVIKRVKKNGSDVIYYVSIQPLILPNVPIVLCRNS